MRLGCVLLFSLAVFGPTVTGCHRNRDSADSPSGKAAGGYGLGSSDADDRKDAAEKLRQDGGPPPDAVPYLIAAVQRESDNDARAEMLMTLGASGAQEALPYLQAGLGDREKDVREAAQKGLKYWNKKNGQIEPEKLAKLQSPEWKERRDAADDLREDGGPPMQAVPALTSAAGREKNPKALGAMLMTLGASGAPDAKPLIEAHMEDSDSDLRRYARKAMKSWLAKNGTAVRRDVEAGPQAGQAAPAAGGPTKADAKPAASASAAAQSDGCDQFKGICGADPFALDKCKTDMKPLSYSQQVAWADCVNASTDSCQKAHDSCVAKVKQAHK